MAGNAKPVHVITSGDLIENGGRFRLQGGAARRVSGFDASARGVHGGAAQPVYIVSDADVQDGLFTVDGGDPLVVAEALDRGVLGGVAIPIYVVNDWSAGVAVMLSWTDNADNEDGFEVERSPDGSTGWTQIGTTGANVTTFRDDAPVEGAINYYRVRAVNAYGNSAYTSTASVTV